MLESYSVYLGHAQKVQTLAFLYELLMHREGDIRRQSAALMGEIIARFHAGYVKESPDGCAPDGREEAGLVQWRLYLAKLIRPDRKLMAQHRRWIGFTLKMVVNSVLEKCPADRRGLFLQEFLRYYRRPERLEDETAFQLLETATALPVEVLADRQRMLTSLRIHGVAAFRLSRNISDTASLGRAGGFPRPVISPMASSRSSAREGHPAQSTSRRAPSSTSWVEMAGRR